MGSHSILAWVLQAARPSHCWPWHLWAVPSALPGPCLPEVRLCIPVQGQASSCWVGWFSSQHNNGNDTRLIQALLMLPCFLKQTLHPSGRGTQVVLASSKDKIMRAGAAHPASGVCACVSPPSPVGFCALTDTCLRAATLLVLTASKNEDNQPPQSQLTRSP